jgi:hypothetical protein
MSKPVTNKNIKKIFINNNKNKNDDNENEEGKINETDEEPAAGKQNLLYLLIIYKYINI